uniref:Inhibitor of growth protein n=1 Tax=Rhabditophanes sp. KR3021 TaxID=114890 RepID=A0AC35UAF0_9BILA
MQRHLENYLDLLEELPIELRNTAHEIRKLDVTPEEYQSLHAKEEEYFAHKEEMSKEEQEKKFHEINDIFDNFLERQKKKIELSKNLSNLLETYNEKYEKDIATFAKEIDEECPGTSKRILDELSTKPKKTRRVAEKSNRRRISSLLIDQSFNNNLSQKFASPNIKRQLMSYSPPVSGKSSIIYQNELSSSCESVEYASNETQDDNGEDKTPWCFCREKAYEEMIKCDSPTCRYQWFHYVCVNIKTQPENEWYCPECLEMQEKFQRN